MAQLPPDSVFLAQITIEAAEDPQFLEAMKGRASKARLSASIGCRASARQSKSVAKPVKRSARAGQHTAQVAIVAGAGHVS